MLIKLMRHIRQFQTKPHEGILTILKRLSDVQFPETLLITCIDSRIGLITQSQPGELLVHRNAGNIVPAYPNESSEAATIEYALKVLKVKDIIICGHSDCGAVKGLLSPTIKTDLPSVASWVSHSHSVLEEIGTETNKDDFALKVQIAIRKNVLAQIEHLKTYPHVAEKLASKQLTIHGWVYHFETGEVSIYEPKQNDFVKLETALQFAIEERRNRIVKTIAMNYLAQFTHPQTASDYRALMHLFSLLEKDLTPIWGRIKGQVLHSLWTELGELYDGPKDPDFRMMAKLGVQVKLDNLKDFQKNIQESAGYNQYCSQLIRHTLFGGSVPLPKLPIVIPHNLYGPPSM
ncbi:carbonic anhydrase [Legionella feeleii]|uniref:carbonic anhydrase n=1 Tax=Legionella feeleii TaxID=453 RepID=A0A0W0THU4_9GAMM|nr:carbonic anhydrase [Legionella feeleii]KTC95160.1 carbonic anhydrase [Legionella feeleii]SPX62482.1 carbonic anhydrase [Legionella feeleii]